MSVTSLISSISLVAGDSSDIYYFSSPDFTDFADENWVGKAIIRNKSVTGDEVLSIDLIKEEDETDPLVMPKFIFKITPTQSATLIAGNYYLIIEIKNLSLNFRRELVRAKLQISASGVSNT